MSSAFIEYLDCNMWEYYHLRLERGEPTAADLRTLITPNAVPILALLTSYGADLNARFDGGNLLQQLCCIDVPGVAADIARFALSHGADYTFQSEDGDWQESFFDVVDLEIMGYLHDSPESTEELLYPLYMVALAFSGMCPDFENPSEPVDGFDFAEFRAFEKYGWEEYREGTLVLHRFFEKETHRIVAIY